MEPYVYQPLSLDAETRVIELDPARDKSDPLHCTLRELNTQNDEEGYYAISYTWGTSALTEPLIIDDEYILLITPSSRDALRRFRSKSDRRRLWIDGICINQQDEVEKSRQIPFMSRIYRSASSVLIWVGDDIQGASCLQMMSKCARKHHLNPQDDATIVEALQTFTALPWFKRRWVVQEAVLNADNLICCGNKEISWFKLAQILTRVDSKSLPAFESLQTMMDLWRSRVLGSGEDSRLTMLRLLTSFDGLGCADDRDRIYSLMGLATDIHPFSQGQHGPDGRIELRVDYEDDTKTVYTNFAKSFLTKDEDSSDWFSEPFGNRYVRRGLVPRLLIDQVAARRTIRRSSDGWFSQLPDWPSWVPDWRDPVVRPPFT